MSTDDGECRVSQFESTQGNASMKYFGTGVLFCMLLGITAPTLYGQSTIAVDDLSVDPRGDSGVKFTSLVATHGIHLDTNQRMKMRPYPTEDQSYLVYVAFDKTSP